MNFLDILLDLRSGEDDHMDSLSSAVCRSSYIIFKWILLFCGHYPRLIDLCVDTKFHILQERRMNTVHDCSSAVSPCFVIGSELTHLPMSLDKIRFVRFPKCHQHLHVTSMLPCKNPCDFYPVPICSTGSFLHGTILIPTSKLPGAKGRKSLLSWAKVEVGRLLTAQSLLFNWSSQIPRKCGFQYGL